MHGPITRSIRDVLPTRDAVLGASTSFATRYWDQAQYPNLRSGIEELELGDGQRVARSDVFNRVARNPKHAVMLTLVWGFPEATINGMRHPLESLFGNAEQIANCLNGLQRREPLPARELIDQLNRLCGSGVSTSTTSKLAYFFGLETHEGPCVIYDYRVINSLMRGEFREFENLRRLLPTEGVRRSRDWSEKLSSAQRRQTQTFGAYLATVDRVAKRLSKATGSHITSAQIELGLFEGAPKSSEMRARSKMSKWKQEQRERRKLRSRTA